MGLTHTKEDFVKESLKKEQQDCNSTDPNKTCDANKQQDSAQDDQKTDKCPLAVESAAARTAQQKKLETLLILLFWFVISPVFFQLNSQGCPTLRIPFATQAAALVDYAGRHFAGSKDGAEQKSATAVEKDITATLESKEKYSFNAFFGMNWYKNNQTSSFKYVNVTMCIAAYLLGIILLATICYRINKSLQRDKIIRENNETFQTFFTKLSPKHEEYKEMFVQEIMRIYFNKKGE